MFNRDGLQRVSIFVQISEKIVIQKGKPDWSS